MNELGKLVAQLGLVQKSSKSSGQNGTPKRSPTVGWGRGVGDQADGIDGRLPTIREDKYFPRRTMEYVNISG
jgi:hypothetical protein